jgi:hypothetical protein
MIFSLSGPYGLVSSGNPVKSEEVLVYSYSVMVKEP